MAKVTGFGKEICIIDADGTNTVSVNDEGQMHVVLMGKVDDGNSTNTTLTSDEVFTGTAFNTLDYGFIFVTIFSDVASATDGLSFQQSSDGTNWDNTDDFNYIANTGKTYSIQPGAKWFRIVYTNGATNQVAFRLSTIFKKTSSLASSHRISDDLSIEDDATLNISVIKGQKPNGNYTDFSSTAGGNFKVSLEEFDETFNDTPLPVTVTKKFNGTPTVEDEVQITNNVANLAVSTNLDRVYLAISIKDKDAWIRLMPASTDNSIRKGIYIKKDQTYELPLLNIYTGEISIINKKNGEKPKYFVTEY